MSPPSFARSAGTLASGTVAAQVLAAAAAPVLSRLYDPQDFGNLAVFTSLMAILVVSAAGRYELAVPLPSSDREASHIMVLALTITLGVSLVCAVVVLVAGGSTANLLGAPAIAGYLWLLPVAMLLQSYFQIFEKWSVRRHAYRPIAVSKVGQTFATVGVQLAGFGVGSPALIGGVVAGQAVGVVRLGRIARRGITRASFNRAELWRVARRYRNFPLFSSWTGLLNTSSIQFAPLLLAGAYGAGAAGLYALTLRILALPLNLVGAAIGSAFLGHGPAAARGARLKPLVQRLHSSLGHVATPGLVLVVVAGPDLFALVFGEQWRQAGTYARWMAPWIYLQFQWSPLSTLATVLELQRAALVSQGLGFLARVGALLGCYAAGAGADVAIGAFAAASALTYAATQLWFLGRVGIPAREIVCRDISSILLFSLQTSPAIALYLASGSVWASTGAAVWFGGATVLWYLRLRR